MKKFTFGCFFLIISCNFLYAQYPPITPFTTGYEMEIGARAFSLGGAFTAVSNDNSALFYNPAGLGQIKNFSAMGCFSNIQVKDQVTFLGAESSQQLDFTKMNSFSAVIPVPTYQGSLVLGLGFHRVRDFGHEFVSKKNVPAVLWNYPITIGSDEYFVDFDVNDSAEEYQQGELNQTSLGASLEVAPDVFLGGSINFWSGVKEYTWKFSEIGGVYDIDLNNDSLYDTTWMLSDYDKEDHYKEIFSGLNFTFGFLKKSGNFSIGGVIKSPVTLKGKQDWDYYYQEYVYEGYESVPDSSADGYIDYKIRSPWIIRGGVSFKLKLLRLSGDVELMDYGQIQYTTEPPVGYKSEENSYIRHNLRSTINYAMGGELNIPGIPGYNIFLRGGYSVKKSPLNNAKSAWNRTTKSLGIGILFSDQIICNIGYGLTSWKNENTAYNALVEKEKINISTVLVDFVYRM